jgi:predicted AAA+ superfamily ATPase
MIERRILSQLQAWKARPERKVLLLRGARQVGKTFTVREFAKSFHSCIEINFVETPEVANFFRAGSLEPVAILKKLEAYYGVSLEPGSSLLFFDEIQGCPEAIAALRFFHEKLPTLHVIAAGSLLEFALADTASFGVGRIESLFMYPVSVAEFFAAMGAAKLYEACQAATPTSPLDETLHRRACELLKEYSIIGGLPAVVQTYVDTKDLAACSVKLDDLRLGYEDDFSKYKTRISPLKLRETLIASAAQAGSKFVYSHIKPGSSTSGYDQALELLRLAGLVYVVQSSAANGVPLGAEVNQRRFKVIPFDLGLYNRLMGLRPFKMLLDGEHSLVNSGALAEVLCGLELIAQAPSTDRAVLYYWAREERGSSAEVDYLVEMDGAVLPIEVKANRKGQMQSLYLLMKMKGMRCGVRSSLENFSRSPTPDGAGVVEVVPLYAVGGVRASSES